MSIILIKWIQLLMIFESITIDIIKRMKTNRSLRSVHSQFKYKHSNSPTISSSISEKGFWSKSFKNQPFPKELKRRLIGHKFKFSDFSDQEEDISGVVVEEEEIEVLEKKKMLPHVTIMSDRGEFSNSRNRIKSQRKFRRSSQRSKSVESLKLPQVMQEKKQEDELQKLGRSKLSQFKDKNQFNRHHSRYSENNSLTQNSRESHKQNNCSSVMPQQIVENEAQETKSQKLKRDKSMLQNEFDKLIVDEVDDKKWKKEDSQQQIQSIIEEDFLEHETDNVNNLRISLGKFQQQAQYLNTSMDRELHYSSKNSQTQNESEKQTKKQSQHQTTINECLE